MHVSVGYSRRNWRCNLNVTQSLTQLHVAQIYYTLRELSNATAEIWAIRSLGHEILKDGKGGGFPWCREHFVTDYTPQWYEHFEYTNELGITADASILTAESDSRGIITTSKDLPGWYVIMILTGFIWMMFLLIVVY